MYFKKIEKNQDNSIGFQETIQFNGNKIINNDSLLFTYASLDNTTNSFGNIFKSLKLPITGFDEVDFQTKYKNTALQYLPNREIIIVEIPKGEYGELIDGKTFSLKIPINNSAQTATLFGTYFEFSSDLNKKLSDSNKFSEVFGYEPTKENGFNSNITYLFSDFIQKPIGEINENIVFTTQTLTITGDYTFNTFTVTGNDIIYITLEDASGLRNNGNIEDKVSFRIDNRDVLPNTFYVVPESVVTNINVTVRKELIINGNINNPICSIKISKFDFTNSNLEWNQYTTTNKFPLTNTNINGKRYAKFSGTQINFNGVNYNFPAFDKPVGILYQDMGLAVITDSTLINLLSYSSATSTGYNDITSGLTYSGDINFTKIYFSTSAECKFNSITTEYVQNITCIAMPNEFYDTNNSTYEAAYDDNVFEKPVFITTIGLYNKYGELIGIGKTSEPIKKTKTNIVPFNIKLKI